MICFHHGLVVRDRNVLHAHNIVHLQRQQIGHESDVTKSENSMEGWNLLGHVTVPSAN